MVYVRFIVSRPFYEGYFPEIYSEKLVNEMLELSKKFETFYRPFEEKIFDKMQELLGGTFPDNFINVCFLPRHSGKKSMSIPTLVKIYPDNFHLTLKTLIHELTHYYLAFSPESKQIYDDFGGFHYQTPSPQFKQFYDDFGSFHYKNLQTHSVVNWVTEKIMLDLFDKKLLDKTQALKYKNKEYEKLRMEGINKLGNTTNLIEKIRNGVDF